MVEIIKKKIVTLVFLVTFVLMILSVVSANDNSTDTSVSSDIQSTTHEVEQTSNEVKDTSQSSQTNQNTQSDQQVQQDSKEVQQSTQTTEKTSQNTANSTKEVKTSTDVTKNNTQDIQNTSQKASNTSQNVENNTTSSDKSNTTEVTINEENKTINENDYALNSTKDLKTASSYTADTYTDLYNQVELIKNSYSSSSSYTINLVSGRNYYVLNRINWGSSNYVKSLTINGNGAVINAIDNYEFLYINGGYSLTLNNVTITNTKNYNFIHNYGSLTLNNCMFLNNNYTIIYNSGTAVVTNSISQDYNSYYYIFDNRENLTVKNCSFKYTYKGSCIHNTKNAYIYNSTFSYNYASPIYSTTNSYTYINSSTFENNNDTYGGAIYTNGNVTINNTVFKNNRARYGGAIYGGNLTIDKSSFITNTATLGYPVLYTNIKAILSNSIICYENYAKSELMGLKDVIFESNNQYIYGSSITYSTSISASNFSTKTNTKTQINATIKGSDGSIPSGSVKITINGNTYTTNINSDGSIRYNYTFSNTGSYSIKIEYAGSNSYNASSKTITATVTKAIVGTYIITYDKNATVGQSTNLYGYVYGNDNSIPSGSVTITVNGKSYTSSIGSDGYVHISYTFGSTGSYTVKISYAGSSSYSSSSSSFTVTVKSAAKINTYITTSDKTATVNKSTNLYGYIKANDGTIPKGSVTITVNGKDFTSSIGSDGYVHISYTFGSAKSYTVKISYAGNSTYSSSSSSFTVTVKSATKINTYITTSDKTATVNKSTNLYGYIKANDGTIPKGSVTITVNGKDFTSSIGSDGYVHISYTFGSAKSYTVKISYAGNSTYSSSSSTFTVTVKSATKINTYITTSDKTATVNKSTNLYGYIKANDGTIPKGSVTITVNGKSYTSTIGSDGYVHISYIFGSAKSYTIKISYAGNSTYSSSSSTFTVTVKTNIKNTTITTQNKNATINKSTNLYGYIKASDNTIPTGTVTITVNGKNYTSTIGSDGYVHIEYTFTNYGNYNVKISYAGKGNYNSSSSTFTVSIAIPKTVTVNSFTQLYDTIEIIKTYDNSGTYTINLVDGNYKITNTINWGSTKGVKNLIINGNGVNLYGSDKQEFLKIASGYTVTLNNIGIINANSSSSAGSILNAGNLTVNNSTFNNSKATTDGGAIYNSGTLNLTNTNFNNCKANNGAAIYNTGKLNMTNTNFTQSKGSDRGGAIYNSGTLYITNSNFNNSNATNGGAIYNTGKLNISNTNFTKNQASDTGGAIYTTNDGTTTLINTNFTSNDGKKGGAIYVKGKTSINNGNFSKNNATNGGAIYTVGTLTMINSYLNDNTASSYGGAIFSTDPSVISMNSTQLKNNTAPKGGAIYNNGTIYSNASSLYNNLATQGGAIYNLNYLNMTSPSFYYNSAERGGVIFNGGSNAYTYVNNSNCFNNSAVYGGVIFNYNNSYIRISSSTFKYNEANNCEILRNDNATAILSSCDISYTSSLEGDTILSLNNAKTNLSDIQYTKLNKSTPIIYCDNELIVVGSNATVSGSIRDSRFNLIKSPFTVTITLQGNTFATKTISDGIIEIPITIDDNYIGEYNLTITIKESENYTSASANILLMKDDAYDIVVPSITAKNNETVTLTAYITDANGYRVTNGTATFKLNYNTIKSNGTNILVNITNGVAKYTFKVPDNYSAKDYNLTAVASVNGRRYEYTTTLTISKTDQQLVTDSVVFTTEDTVRITGQILDVNNHNVTRDVKVAIKINGKTVANTRVVDGKLDITLDLSNYKSGAYTINIVLGENGCYNTAYSNITLIKNLTNSIVVMPTTATHGTKTTLEAYVTDSNGNPQTSGTVSFNIQGLNIANTTIYNGRTELYFNTLEVNNGTYNLTATTKISGKTLTNSTTLIIKEE